MPATGRIPRDERPRSLGQNFLVHQAAERFVSEAGVGPGELVVDIGAGSGALSRALIRRGAQVIAVEADPVWAARLYELGLRKGDGLLQVVNTDFFSWPLPDRPFRVLACPPFGATTAILHRLFDPPQGSLGRADLLVLWEVARKRATTPPATLVSTAWAPWWHLRLAEPTSTTTVRMVVAAIPAWS